MSLLFILKVVARHEDDPRNNTNQLVIIPGT